MSATDADVQAVGLLQELGLKEYEAKCFVGLSRLPQATAKELSDTTGVPRTRVYDAIRVLEAKGLVEIQHGSPQRFRAVPIEEGLETLGDQFDSRLSALGETLRSVEPAETGDTDVDQEVWSLTGSTAVGNRTIQLIEDARSEAVLVIGTESVVSDDLIASLNDRADEITVVVGTLTEGLAGRIRDRLPRATVFTSDLPWLQASDNVEDEVSIGRILLVDRSTMMVSSIHDHEGTERAVFTSGVGNGLVVIARRIMATGLVPSEDPGSEKLEHEESDTEESGSE